jgi:hypothetical protein
MSIGVDTVVVARIVWIGDVDSRIDNAAKKSD